MPLQRFKVFLNEKSVSKSQQRLMGMALAYKRGELDNASDEVKNVANSMSTKELEKFAKTKHDNLPEEVDESNSKTLSIQQRRQAARMLRRRKGRIKLARKRALRRTANTTTLNKRSKRAVRQSLFKKFSRGKSRQDVSVARRSGIERRINRLSPQRIKALTVRQRRQTRQIDRARRSRR